MKYLAFLFFASCAHVRPVAVDCGKDVSAAILPAVETALVASDYVDELTKLAIKFGECVIHKGVVKITGEATQDLRFAQTDQNVQLKYEHGQNWLAAHPEQYRP